MELRVGGNEVLLTLHAAYVTDDDTAHLQQVARFKPLLDYLTEYKPAGDVYISAMIVTNVTFIANRVASVVVDVDLKNKATKESLVQTLALSDDVPVVVLPVLSVGTKHYAMLVTRPAVAIGGEAIVEAFAGAFNKDGSFNATDSDLLSDVGFPVSEKTCTALTAEEVSLGHEGQRPVRLLKANKTFTQDSYDDAFSHPVKRGDATLTLVLLEDVASVSADMKAVLAAALVLKN
jgi:hypothetical protein